MHSDDEIEVGNTVNYAGGVVEAVVLAIGPEWLLARMPSTGQQVQWLVKNCHRVGPIAPEPVVLTPKYSKDQRVKVRNGDEVTIAHPFIAYRTNYNFTYTEDQLEPVPEPCDKCGK